MTWEYKTFKLPVEGFFVSKINIQNFDEKINAITADGWELVTFSSLVRYSLFSGSNTGYIIATFKRPKS